MTEVRAAGETDIPGITQALVRSFHDDPVMSFLFRSDDGRRRKLKALFDAELDRALRKAKGKVHTTCGDDRLGAAIWFAPDHRPLQLWPNSPPLPGLRGAAGEAAAGASAR